MKLMNPFKSYRTNKVDDNAGVMIPMCRPCFASFLRFSKGHNSETKWNNHSCGTLCLALIYIYIKYDDIIKIVYRRTNRGTHKRPFRWLRFMWPKHHVATTFMWHYSYHDFKWLHFLVAEFVRQQLLESINGKWRQVCFFLFQ